MTTTLQVESKEWEYGEMDLNGKLKYVEEMNK
jgi:hypothetical protein